jgi:hypothetical protein
MELRGIGGARQLRIEQGINLYDEVSRFECELIRCALAHTGGNQVRAARLLGLKTTTLHNKIKHYRIPVRKASATAQRKTRTSAQRRRASAGSAGGPPALSAGARIKSSAAFKLE